MDRGAIQVGEVTITRLEEGYGPVFPADVLMPAWDQGIRDDHGPVIDQFVDAAPQVRTEGDVTIIPVVEEVLVVEKRLVLKIMPSSAWVPTTMPARPPAISARSIRRR